jgi:protein-S-isoprenylcysteine O-methyltransferase Ste14
MIAVFYLPPIEFLFFTAGLPRNVWMQIIGLLIIFFGSFLFIWARRMLGKFYSGHLSVVEGQQLVQGGPYRFIRHPAYAGYILIALGLALGYSSLAGWAAILFLLIPSVMYRVHVEDQLLAEYFGAQFNDYARRTKRLFPGIW